MAAPPQATDDSREAVSPADRISALMRGLEDEAARLRHELQRLQETRGQWMSQLFAADADEKGTKILPQVCARQLEEAQACQRRRTKALRTTAAREQDIEKWQEKSSKVKQDEELAKEAAEERREKAEQALQQLRAERKEAEKVHVEQLDAMEASTAESLANLTKRVEEVRGHGASVAEVARKDVAMIQQAALPRSLDDLRNEAASKLALLQESIEEHERRCELELKDAMRRTQDAQHLAGLLTEESAIRIKDARAEAEEEVARISEKTRGIHDITAGNVAELDTQLDADLRAASERELAAAKDLTAEEGMEKVMAQEEESTAQRRLAHDDFMARYYNETARLLEDAQRAALAANERAHVAQQRADAKVEGIWRELEQLGQTGYEGRLKSLRDQFIDEMRKARSEVSERVARFDVEAQEQAQRASRALQDADTRVQSLRDDAARRKQDGWTSMEKNLQLLQEQQKQANASAEAEVQLTQQKMLDYITTQEAAVKKILATA
mmetsp:Transcript_65257/g.155905  ORF Transcript_65257/g.155905 Transcript_65257/m.155905 type:complete len:500 (+) Transcript_65257:126-1625(+)